MQKVELILIKLFLWVLILFPSTALHYAAAKGFLKIVKLLVEKNASIDIVDSEGRNAYDLALSKGRHEVAAYLGSLLI